MIVQNKVENVWTQGTPFCFFSECESIYPIPLIYWESWRSVMKKKKSNRKRYNYFKILDCNINFFFFLFIITSLETSVFQYHRLSLFHFAFFLINWSLQFKLLSSWDFPSSWKRKISYFRKNLILWYDIKYTMKLLINIWRHWSLRNFDREWYVENMKMKYNLDIYDSLPKSYIQWRGWMFSIQNQTRKVLLKQSHKLKISYYLIAAIFKLNGNSSAK